MGKMFELMSDFCADIADEPRSSRSDGAERVNTEDSSV
jgi:hypothetical protein